MKITKPKKVKVERFKYEVIVHHPIDGLPSVYWFNSSYAAFQFFTRFKELSWDLQRKILDQYPNPHFPPLLSDSA